MSHCKKKFPEIEKNGTWGVFHKDLSALRVMLNPILTGFFESKFLLGGGVNLTPPSDLGPEGADRREILHGCEDTSKEYCYGKKKC